MPLLVCCIGIRGEEEELESGTVSRDIVPRERI